MASYASSFRSLISKWLSLCMYLVPVAVTGAFSAIGRFLRLKLRSAVVLIVLFPPHNARFDIRRFTGTHSMVQSMKKKKKKKNYKNSNVVKGVTEILSPSRLEVLHAST
jgi:hypothetical protein